MSFWELVLRNHAGFLGLTLDNGHESSVVQGDTTLCFGTTSGCLARKRLPSERRDRP